MVHEAVHLLSDSIGNPQTMLEAEEEGHTTHAEYRLRDGGVLTDTALGAIVDLDLFDALMNDVTEYEIDKGIMGHLVADAVDENIENNRLRLNGPSLSNPTDAAFFVREFRQKIPFADHYAKVARGLWPRAGAVPTLKQTQRLLSKNKVHNDGR